MDYFAESFKNRVAIVSGAGPGQGKAVVKLLLRNGANVVAFSRSGNKPDLKHDNLKVMKADSSDLGSLNDVGDYVQKKFGRLDFLYNNHGVFAMHSPEFHGNTAVQFFERNVAASINTIEKFYPLMKEGGSIVNVGASPAIYHLSSLEYAVSKKATIEMTRKMASILKSRNIRVNALMPGSVNSSRDVEEIEPFKFGSIDGKKEVYALEVAYAAMFLLSDLSHGINGQSINIDAGMGL